MSDAPPASIAIKPDRVVSNPTQLDHPAFLMNAPFSLSTEIANNIWMEELSESARKVDASQAMSQFLQVYAGLGAAALVYVLPTPRTVGLQDLVYTANLGIVPTHLAACSDVVISNFTSGPRRAETPVGVDFFESMGYRATVCPFRFEGEADLKNLHGNVYAGGYGIRTERAAHAWLEHNFDMRIVPLQMSDPRLYHLDCSIFPLTTEYTLVQTDGFQRHELEALSRYTQIIDVSASSARVGICNSVRCGKLIFNSSCIHDLRMGTSEYDEEKAKIDDLEKIAVMHGFELVLINTSEFQKSGAMLSCMVMHLNRNSYRIPLM